MLEEGRNQSPFTSGVHWCIWISPTAEMFGQMGHFHVLQSHFFFLSLLSMLRFHLFTQWHIFSPFLSIFVAWRESVESERWNQSKRHGPAICLDQYSVSWTWNGDVDIVVMSCLIYTSKLFVACPRERIVPGHSIQTLPCACLFVQFMRSCFMDSNEGWFT